MILHQDERGMYWSSKRVVQTGQAVERSAKAEGR